LWQSIVLIQLRLNQGYPQHYAEAMDGLQLSIFKSIVNMKLKAMKSNNVLVVEGSSPTPQANGKEDIIDIFIGQYSIVSNVPDGLLLHDDVLLPLWTGKIVV